MSTDSLLLICAGVSGRRCLGSRGRPSPLSDATPKAIFPCVSCVVRLSGGVTDVAEPAFSE